MKVLVAGPGNLGSHIARRFEEKNNEVYIWHYDRDKLKEFGETLNVCIIENLSLWRGDIVFITVRDDAIKSVSELISKNVVKVHCSGALPTGEISARPRGVIYPLQSFVKTEPVNWNEIPVFITYEPDSKDVITQAAKELSPKVLEITDEQRLKIHLAAVIINNFVNFTLGMAKKYISRENLAVDWFIPLLNKTVERFRAGKEPLVLQTGPARRHDLKTLHRHLNLLRHSDDKTIYEFYKVLSDIISRYYEREKGK